MTICVTTLLFVSLVTLARGIPFTTHLMPPATIGAPVHQVANITYGTLSENQGLSSIFSPRMDFEQWKPLTGRGDPLRNDPTYDYEPPVLDRVHYWADETRLEREHYPERKSEVLMLGVSSRKPSVSTRSPPPSPLPPRRPIHRPTANNYEDFTYKLSDHYPMTILVPPPPPPPGHQTPLFGLPENNPPTTNSIQSPVAPSIPPKVTISDSTVLPEHLTSFYALQESNLIYQSSTIQNWITNETNRDSAVSSDYAGWGPTTPLDDSDVANETHNIISNDHLELSQAPYAFYKPMLSEAPPPPPKKILNPLIVSTFLPTVLPPTSALETSTLSALVTQPTEQTTEVLDIPTDIPQETTTQRNNSTLLQQTPTPTSASKTETSIFDMLRPMSSMPLVIGPERLEDNLYAYASESFPVFKEHNPQNIQMQTMQTMQPPPRMKQTGSKSVSNKQIFYVNSQSSSRNPALYTHGPYLHGRFTTPIATTIDEYTDNSKSTTEVSTIPMYLIIQGHSKVKTYGSKPKVTVTKEALSNEIPKPVFSDEVKHLHTKKSAEKLDTTDVNRKSRSNGLQSLLNNGYGSIEIQEADVGIKYDVSDGSNVPVEIYRKGIVAGDDVGFSSGKIGNLRLKRQIDLEDLLPFDEDDIEEYIYKFLESKKNETSITGLIAQAVTSDAASAVDELENDQDILDEDR